MVAYASEKELLQRLGSHLNNRWFAVPGPTRSACAAAQQVGASRTGGGQSTGSVPVSLADIGPRPPVGRRPWPRRSLLVMVVVMRKSKA